MRAVAFFFFVLLHAAAFVPAPRLVTPPPPPLRAAGTGMVDEATALVFVAIGGVALLGSASALIGGAYEGGKGLGAFLRDGKGFQGSDYREGDGPRRKPPKFLDKLKLPTLDFVQVYASGEDAALEEAEALGADLQAALDAGDAAKARALETRLARLLRDNGLTLTPTDDDDDDKR